MIGMMTWQVRLLPKGLTFIILIYQMTLHHADLFKQQKLDPTQQFKIFAFEMASKLNASNRTSI